MQKEIRVRKANKVLRVSENEVAKYITNGYDIIDEQGGNMVIRNLSVPVRDVFDVTDFIDAFDIE